MITRKYSSRVLTRALTHSIKATLLFSLLMIGGCATQQAAPVATGAHTDTPAVCALKGGTVLSLPAAAYSLSTGGAAFVVGAVISGTACALAAKKNPGDKASKPIDSKPVESLDNVTMHFDFDSSTLRKNDVDRLNRLLVNYDEDTKIMVEGHTCNIGSKLYNQGLSERRAWSVKKYLVEMGVLERDIETSGKGETMPVRGNETEEMLEENRRAEVWISK